MPAEKKPLLNVSAVENQIARLGLKRLQVAKETGVDRSTVGRWLDGRTKRIRRSNLKRLSQTLDCPATSLVVEAVSDVIASRDDQARIAHLVEKERLLEVLTPHSRWPHLKAFVKAATESDLPLTTMGKLLNYLAVACLRKNRADTAEEHATEAMELGERIDNYHVLAEADLNLGAVADAKGAFEVAAAHYRACLARSQHLDGALNQATALSGLAGSCDAIGDLETSETLQRKAIAVLRKLRRPAELSSARRGLGFLLTQMNRLDVAERALTQATVDAKTAASSRDLHLATLGLGEVAARRGDFESANTFLGQTMDWFENRCIDNGLNFEIEARVARFEGRFDDALDRISAGFACANGSPFRQAKLHVERMSVAVAMRDSDTEQRERAAALKLLERCGAHRRVAALRLGS